MIRAIKQIFNKFYIFFFTNMCLFSYGLFDRAACLIYDDSLLADIRSSLDHQSIAATDMRAAVCTAELRCYPDCF